MISSKKVKWAKQGTVQLLDNEPPPPEDEMFASESGWKEVSGFKAVQGGGDYLFPKDQLLLVAENGDYKPLNQNSQRLLGKLHAEKHYLVWWHHLLPLKVWKEKQNK